MSDQITTLTIDLENNSIILLFQKIKILHQSNLKSNFNKSNFKLSNKLLNKLTLKI